MKNNNFFPIFKKCDNRLVIVFGGGKIAYRRVSKLLEYNVRIRVVSKDFNNDFALINRQNIELIIDEFHEKYIEDCFFVLACTDDLKINKQIVNICKKVQIEVNNSSCKEDSTFYFPYNYNDDEINLAIIGNGNDHKKLKETADKIKKIVEKREF